MIPDRQFPLRVAVFSLNNWGASTCSDWEYVAELGPGRTEDMRIARAEWAALKGCRMPHVRGDADSWVEPFIARHHQKGTEAFRVTQA